MRDDIPGGPTTAAHAGPGGGRRWSPWKIAVWAAPALLMLLMLVNNQRTDEEGWSAGDFVFATVVLYGALAAYERVARLPGGATYRAGFAVGIVTLVGLVWGNGALGITDTDADAWYLAVLAVGIVGPFVARFRPRGMALATAATAVTMGLVSGAALAAGKVGPNNSALQVLGITAFYTVLFAGSAWLFREAARGGHDRTAA